MVYPPTNNRFEIADYVVFAVFLVISMAIGIFFSVTGGRQKSTEEYLMGDRRMSMVPTAISMLVSITSAILILGSPSEIYQNGLIYAISAAGDVISRIITAIVFVPIFYRLHLISSFEYLELRFKSKLIRRIASVLYVICQTVYVGIAVYAPSTAMEFLTGGQLPTMYSILLCGAVGTLYTAIGGMKAVIWSDVFQSLVMVAGILAIIIKAAIEVGGLTNVFAIANANGRINFGNFSPDPRERHTVWSLTIATGINWVAVFGVNQVAVQRYCAVSTLAKARGSMFITMVAGVFMNWCCCLAGLAIFAYYTSVGCDPIAAGYVRNQNQIVPYFVMDLLHVPAVPGIFAAALFAGALSSVSSALNAMSAIVWKDFLQALCFTDASDAKGAVIAKLLVVAFGVVGTAMGFGAIYMGGSVLQACLAFTGSVNAPIMGLFVLGMLFRHVNKYGALIGSLCGAVFSIWITIGAYVTGKPIISLPTNTTDCLPMNVTHSLVRSDRPEVTGFLNELYSLSYLWIPVFGLLTTIVMGIIVTGLSGPTPSDPDERLFHTLSTLFCWCCKDDGASYDVESSSQAGRENVAYKGENGMEMKYQPYNKDGI